MLNTFNTQVSNATSSAPTRPAPTRPAFFPGYVNPTCEIDAKVNLVLSRLPKGAPYWMPKHIAPELGITENGFTKHCRNFRALDHWRGYYQFQTDDEEHMTILRGLLVRILWSGLNLPDDLRVSASRARTRVH